MNEPGALAGVLLGIGASQPWTSGLEKERPYGEGRCSKRYHGGQDAGR
jgi:hypothetical protein